MRQARAVRLAIYPGSFNPPTTAHLAVAAAVRTQRNVDRVVLSISSTTLAKESVQHPLLRHRMTVLEAIAESETWLEIRLTDAQLLADIAVGYDVLVMGADKWHQINDPVWYDNDPDERDRAIARLPELAIAPRPPLEVPSQHVLDVHQDHHEVSSTRARGGDLELMTCHAQHFALETGAWISPSQYEEWLPPHYSSDSAG